MHLSPSSLAAPRGPRSFGSRPNSPSSRAVELVPKLASPSGSHNGRSNAITAPAAPPQAARAPFTCRRRTPTGGWRRPTTWRGSGCPRLPRGGPGTARTLPPARCCFRQCSPSAERLQRGSCKLASSLLQRRRPGDFPSRCLGAPAAAELQRGSPGRPGPAVDAVRAPGRAAGPSSYLEARTIRKTWPRCRGSTSSRSRGAGSGQVPPRQRARRRLPELRWPALLSPRRPSPPRGAAGAASGARIARAGLGAAVAPLAGSLGRGAASPELAAETEATTGKRASESLASSPRLPLQAPRDGGRVGVGVAGGRGRLGLSSHVPTPFLSPSSPASSLPPPLPPTPHPPGLGGQGSACGFRGWGRGEPGAAGEGAAGASGTGWALTAGPARWGRGLRSRRDLCVPGCPVPGGWRVPAGGARSSQLGGSAPRCWQSCTPAAAQAVPRSCAPFPLSSPWAIPGRRCSCGRVGGGGGPAPGSPPSRCLRAQREGAARHLRRDLTLGSKWE